MFDTERIRMDFPILQQEVYGKPLIYLDNAATTQLPRQVVECISEHYFTSNANIHRGVHFLSEKSSKAFEDARKKVRNFINAASEQEVCFTSGTTASINLVAGSYGDAHVKEGDEIIVSSLEHHSNLIPWQQLCRKKGARLNVIPDNNGELDLGRFSALLNRKTKMVALTQVSNVIGSVTPLDQVIRVSHDAGVPVLVDGAQGIRHGIIDVQELDCDFYCFSGHKMMAPTGTGVLYAKAGWMDILEPIRFGGGMVNRVTRESSSFAKAPHHFEAGTPNYVGILALGRAIEYLEAVGRQEIADYEASLLAYAEQQLQTVEPLNILGRPNKRAGVLSLTLPGIHPYDMASLLDKCGIAVRSGSMCAQPVLESFGVDSVIRVSPAFYNTKTEIDSFIKALTQCSRMLIK